ncbi:hypothetical protein EDC94DRAFT_613149 [Helicostylum pulchrum]|nr:hypothetical protein EDC94DRAFT_613149 [Helicostylum pulchrum]
MINLPYEIYLKIFSLLHKSLVKDCVMVCKEWSMPAFQAYFKEVIINDHNTGTLKALVDQGQYFKYCHWTEKLTVNQESSGFHFNREPEVEFTKEEFLKLIKCFPNLKKIEIRTNKSESNYTRYLLDIDSNHYLTRLESIILRTDTFCANPSNLYCSVYYKFRASLTRISLEHERKSVLASKYGGVLNYLNQFKKLTHLTYCNNSGHYTPIYEIQVACPSLTSIQLISHYSSPLLRAGDNIFDQNSNLKELSLSFPNISTRYIETITKYLPESVKKLDITITEIDLYDWIDQVGIENVLQLAERMSNLPKASFQCIPDKEYETEHENIGESNMTIFFKVLNAFKGDKKVPCTASFSDFRSVHNYMRFNGENISIEYGLNYADLYDDSGEERTLEFSVPDRTASIIGPEIINSLSFYICTVDPELTIKLLKYSLINCTHLQHVEFKGMNSPHHEFVLSSNIDYFHEGIETYDLTATSKENLKTVKLKNFIPSKEYIDLLANHLPDLQIFTCGGRLGGRFDNSEESQDHKLDLTRFKSLKIVYFDVQLVSIGSKLIKFEYVDGEEKFYQLKDKKDTSFEAISLEDIKNNQTTPIGTIVFECEKIERFTLCNARGYNFLEIFRGIPQKKRSLEVDDMKYMYI